MTCRVGKHVWEPMRGTTRERCATCGTEYPCAHDCRHADCAADAGRPMPDGVVYVPKSVINLLTLKDPE